MHKILPMRMVFISFAGVSQGLTLAWALTFERSGPNQVIGILAVIGLFWFFHTLSSRILGKSVLIITSYVEGLFFFIVSMASFRIGDYILGITRLSVRTELFLFGLAAIFGTIYVWAVRRMVEE